MSAVSFTEPRLDDTEQRLLYKIARGLGPGAGSPQFQIQGAGSGVAVSGSPPGIPFSYTPATNVMLWNDVHGGHVGDLAAFNASPDAATTVTSIQVHVLSSITGLSSLPMLISLDIGPPGLGTPGTVSVLDLTGCGGLLSLICDANSLTALDVSPCTNLALLTCQLNLLGTITVKAGTPLTTFFWAANPSPTVVYV